MAGSDYTANFTGNSRIAHCNGTWQAVCDGDVVDWDKTVKFWIALLASCTSHTCGAVTMRLQWRNLTDGGAWTDLGTTGELIQATGCTDPGASACQTIAERGVVQGGNSYSFASHAKNEYIEMVTAVDPANALDGKEYEFRLYDVTAGAPLDLAGYATITIFTAITNINISDSGTGSEALAIEAQIPVSDSGLGSESLAIEASLGITDDAIGSEAIGIEAQLTITDSGSGSESILVIHNLVTIPDSAVGSEALAIEAQVPVSDSGSGSEALAIEAQIPVSDSGLGSGVISITASISVSDSALGSESISKSSSVDKDAEQDARLDALEADVAELKVPKASFTVIIGYK